MMFSDFCEYCFHESLLVFVLVMLFWRLLQRMTPGVVNAAVFILHARARADTTVIVTAFVGSLIEGTPRSKHAGNPLPNPFMRTLPTKSAHRTLNPKHPYQVSHPVDKCNPKLVRSPGPSMNPHRQTRTLNSKPQPMLQNPKPLFGNCTVLSRINKETYPKSLTLNLRTKTSPAQPIFCSWLGASRQDS